MKKYVGMTSRDPYLRKQEWIATGRVMSNFQVIKQGVTYEVALTLETHYKAQGYEAEPGGPRIQGAVYSVYTYDY